MPDSNRNSWAISVSAAPVVLAWPKLLARALLSLGLCGAFLWLLLQRLAHLDLAEMRTAFGSVSATHWLAAVVLTGVSFWAVGRYDAVLHRHFATGLPESITRRAGICAIAVSQTLGLGVITGAILRWRMLPGQSLWLATRLTAAVALSFLAGWAVVTASVLLALPEAPFKLQAVAALALAGMLAALAIVAPRVPFRWPNAFTLSRLLGLAALDTLAAAAAFYMLCPEPLALPFAAVLPAFLLAFGAGLASGTPGGVGPFEITLLALLPDEPQAALLAAVLAWRGCYYALPALLGAALAIKGPGVTSSAKAPAPALLAQAPRAEAGLWHQGQHDLIGAGSATLLAARTPHLLVALFDPVTGSANDSLPALHQAARAESRLPVLYKCSARTAVCARRHGLLPLLIAQEAWLDPRSFRLCTSSRAGLRRKLRRAEAAGVRISGPASPQSAPWPALDDIATSWARAHGGERGFSMGRYARSYLAQQHLYIAWQDDLPIAFVSFHHSAQEWTLDLMRHGTNLPDGTMQLLIQTAITDAARQGLPRLSLAAVPSLAAHPSRALRLIRTALDDCAGLARFKSSFAPQWQPLYLLAPNRATLALAAAEIGRAVLLPQALRPAAASEIEHHHDKYEIASARPPWQRHAKDLSDEVGHGRAFETALHPGLADG